jgi:hypothetical protein
MVGYLFFTGASLSIAAIRFLIFVDMDSLIFVEGLSKVGIITLISGILGLFLDQASQKNIGDDLSSLARPYGLVLLVISFLLLIQYSSDNNSYILITGQSCALAVCLVSRGACAAEGRQVLHQTLSVSYGLYIFLVTLTHTVLKSFDLNISFLLIALAAFELLSSTKSQGFRLLPVKYVLTNVKKIKSHFCGYFMVFFSMKIMEYLDKFYCDYFGCSEILANYVKIASLLFAAAGIVWSFIVNGALVNFRLKGFEKILSIALYIPICLFVIYRNNSMLSSETTVIVIVGVLILLSNLCQELRAREIYLLESGARSTQALGRSAIKAGLLAFIPLALSMPYYSYGFYLVTRYIFFKKSI